MKLFVFIVDTCGIQVKVGSTVKAPVDLLLSRLPHIDERKKKCRIVGVVGRTREQ